MYMARVVLKVMITPSTENHRSHLTFLRVYALMRYLFRRITSKRLSLSPSLVRSIVLKIWAKAKVMNLKGVENMLVTRVEAGIGRCWARGMCGVGVPTKCEWRFRGGGQETLNHFFR